MQNGRGRSALSLRSPDPFDRTHVISINGEVGTGKTYLATSGPAKTFIQSTDCRYADVIRRFSDFETRFLVEDYVPLADLSADALFQDARYTERDSSEKLRAEQAAKAESAKVEREVWRPFKNDVDEAIKRPDVPVIVWDQADEFNELLRLVNFGKLEQNPQLNYGPVNQEFKALIKNVRKAKKVLVMVHQNRDQYRTGEDGKGIPTGRREMRWNKSAAPLIDSFVETRKVDGKFIVVIEQAKLNPVVDGAMLESPTWVELMAALAPNVAKEAWA